MHVEEKCGKRVWRTDGRTDRRETDGVQTYSPLYGGGLKTINSHFKNHSEKDTWYPVLQTLGSNKSKSMHLLEQDIWILILKPLSPYGFNIQQIWW